MSDKDRPSKASRPFWETTALADMSDLQWESLCDGCARCCMHKMQDIETGEVAYTQVACRLLDSQTCRCTNYAQRTLEVPECVRMGPADQTALGWLPSSCAYRRLAEGLPLNWWHPLVSGDPNTVHLAGISMRDRCIDQERVDDANLADYHTGEIEWQPLRRRPD